MWRSVSDMFNERLLQEETSNIPLDIQARSSRSGVEIQIWLSPAFGRDPIIIMRLYVLLKE